MTGALTRYGIRTSDGPSAGGIPPVPELDFDCGEVPERILPLLRKALADSVRLGTRIVSLSCRTAPSAGFLHAALQTAEAAGVFTEFIVPFGSGLPSAEKNSAFAFRFEPPFPDFGFDRIPRGSTVFLPYSETAYSAAELFGLREKLLSFGLVPELECSEEFLHPDFRKLQELLAGPDGAAAEFPFDGAPCMKFAETCFIVSDGTVFPCAGRRLPMGNLNDSALAEIAGFSHFRGCFRNYRKTVKEPCRSCANSGICAGCRARAFESSGDPLSPDPFCVKVFPERARIAHLPLRDAESAMPQKPPMRMAGTLTKIGDNCNEGEAVIAADNPFLRKDGTLDPAALIEIAAQQMAQLDTFLNPYRPLEGALVEVMRFSSFGIPVRAGAKIFILSRKTSELEPWHIGSFEITSGKQEKIAEGEFKVCQFSDVLPQH